MIHADFPEWLVCGHPCPCQWPLHPNPNKIIGSPGWVVMDLYFGCHWDLKKCCSHLPPGKEFLQQSSYKSMYGLIHWQSHSSQVQPVPKVPSLIIALWTKPPTAVCRQVVGGWGGRETGQGEGRRTWILFSFPAVAMYDQIPGKLQLKEGFIYFVSCIRDCLQFQKSLCTWGFWTTFKLFSCRGLFRMSFRFALNYEMSVSL